ncbi:Inner nuclear membrane protein MAN [Parasponia andersonii]|uniref:Inner nuclear membrane protein MAN n=1 Tax=Parasponia andersonii TaxID=3476 RepID=A0A2P5AC66_PARAD|nr:Inner nuclear membrane protein MAN [Parasponia andersonii]
MSSSSKKRPKPKSHSNAYASSSSNSFLWEPPDDFFPSKDDLFRLLAGLAIAASVALACNFFANSFMNRHPKPFCDTTLGYSDSLSDHCEPCPSNGQCYEGKLECHRGYRKHGNLCIEDGDINQTAKKLSEWVQLRLCESYAQYLCGGPGMIWVQEDDIWSDLDGHELMEHIGLDSSISNYTKHKAMGIIGKVLEMRKNSQGVKELKCPDVLAENYKAFSCRVQQWISNNVLVILPVFVLLVGFILLIWKVRQKLYLSKRVEELYQQVCEILEENALTSKTVNGESESWVVASRLRDHLLSPKERKNPVLWKKVEALVQEDSRVDRYPKLVKGESKVVWEWQVEGSLSSTKLRKKGETIKLKSPESMSLNSVQHHHHRLKTETKAPMF